MFSCVSPSSGLSLFFFSSRRRHTRLQGDWSSDVCSSDLRLWTLKKGSIVSSPVYHDGHLYWMHDNLGVAFCAEAQTRSEERRVGKGRRQRVMLSPCEEKRMNYQDSN